MMKPVSELRDDELARLVRSRLEARQPRHLPEHFVPRARPSRTMRWVIAAAALVFLALTATAAARTDLGSMVLSGVFGRQPATHTPTPAPSVSGQRPAPSGTGQRGAGAAPGAGTTSPALPGAAPTPRPSTGGNSLPVPPPSLPVPTPTVCVPTLSSPLPPLPVPTPTPPVCLP